jgi:hypothetical protein
MSKLKEIVARIQLIAPKISGEPLAGARYSPEASASPTQCFSNAQRKAQQSGGGVLYGWMFHYREPTVLPGQGYVLAVNHAVWHAPDKKLIDVTPFHDNPHHHPIVVNGDAVLFLIDSTATPLRSDHAGLALPSWFFPLTDDEAIATYVAELTAKELTEWEAQVADTDEFINSMRATELLRARRGERA